MRRALGRGRRPGLLGTAARTAVVAGTARAASGRVAAAQQAKQAEQAKRGAAAQPVAEQPAAPPVQPAAAPAPVSVEQLHTDLKKLAELRDAGLLTAEEFAAQKARLLAG